MNIKRYILVIYILNILKKYDWTDLFVFVYTKTKKEILTEIDICIIVKELPLVAGNIQQEE